jgi:hypothetical protein
MIGVPKKSHIPIEMSEEKPLHPHKGAALSSHLVAGLKRPHPLKRQSSNLEPCVSLSSIIVVSLSFIILYAPNFFDRLLSAQP